MDDEDTFGKAPLECGRQVGAATLAPCACLSAGHEAGLVTGIYDITGTWALTSGRTMQRPPAACH
jgi:hypothetical protein